MAIRIELRLCDSSRVGIARAHTISSPAAMGATVRMQLHSAPSAARRNSWCDAFGVHEWLTIEQRTKRAWRPSKAKALLLTTCMTRRSSSRLAQGKSASRDSMAESSSASTASGAALGARPIVRASSCFSNMTFTSCAALCQPVAVVSFSSAAAASAASQRIGCPGAKSREAKRPRPLPAESRTAHCVGSGHGIKKSVAVHGGRRRDA